MPHLQGLSIIPIQGRINPIPRIHTYFLRSILILSFRLHLGIPEGLPVKIYKHSYFPPFWLGDLPIIIF